MRILEFPNQIILEKSEKIVQLLETITSLATELNHVPMSAVQKKAIFHQELLTSSLFSAKIEGNALTLIQAKEIDTANPKIKSHREISNVLKARKKIEEFPEKITLKHIQNIHKLVMHHLDTGAGKLRTESSAIFDQYGNIVYLTPSPEEVEKMTLIFLEKINTPTAHIQEQLLVTAQSHYYFEKIHPFIDGNGRTGRIITHYQLKKTKLFADLAIPFEEYFNTHKSDYYELLDQNTRDIENFVVFFFEALVWALQKLLATIHNRDLQSSEVHGNDDKKNSLLPRRKEILNIITDHEYCSFDFISRRFPTISKRTLAYDINTLVKKKLIVKHGETRGVVYSAAK